MLTQANAVKVKSPGTYRAKVGQPVLFGPFGYTVVPSLMYSLKVKINGRPVDDPEIVGPETNPGYAEQVYVFRADKPGTYHVKITKVGLDHHEWGASEEYTLTIQD